jgi:hypothetical protein
MLLILKNIFIYFNDIIKNLKCNNQFLVKKVNGGLGNAKWDKLGDPNR